ncbi:MAG: FAD-dependent oxidoreductase, partial [Actinomycetota bacterium]
MHVLVVGGGVAGLGSALVLARQGHDVVVVERDDTPMPESADEAFSWDRRGAPQVRHSHAFLARLVGLLRGDYADSLTDVDQL